MKRAATVTLDQASNETIAASLVPVREAHNSAPNAAAKNKIFKQNASFYT